VPRLGQFAATEDLGIVAQYTESESGQGAALDKSPQLAAALAAAKSSKCSIVVQSYAFDERCLV
jgi:hypothetical protein